MPTYTLPNDTQKGKDLRDKKLFIIDNIHDEIVFKASAIVLSDATSKGNIIANFDLTVLGDINAQEIEVKGRLICYGDIEADKITADEIIATKMNSKEIVSRAGIMAQELNSDSIQSEGSIIVRKDITVEKLIKTDSAIICGDGFFSYGKVRAKAVMAVDNLELQEDEFEFVKEPLIIEREVSELSYEQVKEAIESPQNLVQITIGNNYKDETLRSTTQTAVTISSLYPNGIIYYIHFKDADKNLKGISNKSIEKIVILDKVTGKPLNNAACESTDVVPSTNNGEGFTDYNSWKSKINKELEVLIKKEDIKELERFLDKHNDLEFMASYAKAVKVIKDNPIKHFQNASNDAKLVDIIQFLKLHKVLVEWQTIAQIESVFDMYCESLDLLQKAAEGRKFEQVAICTIVNYSDFIEVIDIIQEHGTKIADGNALLIAIIDKVYQSALGISAAFLSKKFTKNGWKLNEQ